jgi:hypothetical protein
MASKGIVRASAVISPDGRYRYMLERAWHPARGFVLFVGLNPSTADADREDQTSRVCMNYARQWGYGGLLIGNLFAYRSTDRSVLRRVPDPVGPDNDHWLKRLQSKASLVICAWGESGAFRSRDKVVLEYLRHPHCLVQLKDGQPGHPLYKPANLKPTPLVFQGESKC